MNYDNTFESLVSDPTRNFISDFSNDSDVMLIAFGGIKGGLDIPVFEFFKSTSIFPVKKMYFRDLKQTWYHSNLPGIGNNVDEIASFIINQIKLQKVHRVVMIGNSMGGYAALLFGYLVKSDVIHSFSPQTFISQIFRWKYNDSRWKNQIKNVYKSSNRIKKYFNLRKLFQDRTNRKTKFKVHYSVHDHLDYIHANRMNIFPNVEVIGYKSRGHRLIKYLRDIGELNKILYQDLVD